MTGERKKERGGGSKLNARVTCDAGSKGVKSDNWTNGAARISGSIAISGYLKAH